MSAAASVCLIWFAEGIPIPMMHLRIEDFPRDFLVLQPDQTPKTHRQNRNISPLVKWGNRSNTLKKMTAQLPHFIQTLKTHQTLLPLVSSQTRKTHQQNRDVVEHF